MNKVILSGNLTKDPELRRTQGGKAVLNGTIAVNEYNGGEKTAIFVNFTAWNQTAEYVAKWGRKGSRVELCGRWTQRDWADKNGNTRRSDEVVVENISILFSKEDRDTDTAPAVDSAPTTTADDLPF